MGAACKRAVKPGRSWGQVSSGPISWPLRLMKIGFILVRLVVRIERGRARCAGAHSHIALHLQVDLDGSFLLKRLRMKPCGPVEGLVHQRPWHAVIDDEQEAD